MVKLGVVSATPTHSFWFWWGPAQLAHSSLAGEVLCTLRVVKMSAPSDSVIPF